MGSSPGPVLANIFVGFHESRLSDNTVKQDVYFRYVDDTFVIFISELDCDCFHGKFNLLHPVLKFTVEMEQNNSLSFLAVLMEKEGTGFLTSVYRKPTFTGQYIRWNSFSPKARKISHIKTLVHRALKICSKTKLGSELDRLKNNCSLKMDIQMMSLFLALSKNLPTLQRKNREVLRSAQLT